MFQLENEYRLFDYAINVNDVIQLMIRKNVTENNSPKISKTKSKQSEVTNNSKEKMHIPSCSSAVSLTSDEVSILLHSFLNLN